MILLLNQIGIDQYLGLQSDYSLLSVEDSDLISLNMSELLERILEVKTNSCCLNGHVLLLYYSICVLLLTR